MKKLTLISLLAMAMMFTACDEDKPKETTHTSDTTTHKTQESKMDKMKAVAVQKAEEAKKKAIELKNVAAKKIEEAKKAAAPKIEAAKKKAAEMKVAAAKKYEEAKKVASEKMASAKIAIGGMVANVKARLTAPKSYAKCKGCHGKTGKTKALGKAPLLAGQSKEALVASLKGYKAGTLNKFGMGGLMKSQVASMSEDDMTAVAEFLSAIK